MLKIKKKKKRSFICFGRIMYLRTECLRLFDVRRCRKRPINCSRKPFDNTGNKRLFKISAVDNCRIATKKKRLRKSHKILRVIKTTKSACVYFYAVTDFGSEGDDETMDRPDHAEFPGRGSSIKSGVLRRGYTCARARVYALCGGHFRTRIVVSSLAREWLTVRNQSRN